MSRTFVMVLTLLVGMALIVAGASAQPPVLANETGRVDLPISDFVLTDSLAVAVAGECGADGNTPPSYVCDGLLTVLNVAPQLSPTVVQSVPEIEILGQVTSDVEAFKGIAARDGFAFTVAEKMKVYGIAPTYRLVVFDLTDPAAPVEVASLDIEVPPNYQLKMARAGDALYVGGTTDGLAVFDITVPVDPALVDKPIEGWAVNHLLVDGDRLYVDAGDGFHIFDVADALRPEELLVTDAIIGSIFDVAGNKLLIAYSPTDEPFAEVREYDITDVANPVQTGWYGAGESVLDVGIGRDFFYVSTGELRIFAGNLEDRAEVGRYQPAFDSGAGSVDKLQVQNGLSFVIAFDGLQHSFRAIRISGLAPVADFFLPLVERAGL